MRSRQCVWRSSLLTRAGSRSTGPGSGAPRWGSADRREPASGAGPPPGVAGLGSTWPWPCLPLPVTWPAGKAPFMLRVHVSKSTFESTQCFEYRTCWSVVCWRFTKNRVSHDLGMSPFWNEIWSYNHIVSDEEPKGFWEGYAIKRFCDHESGQTLTRGDHHTTHPSARGPLTLRWILSCVCTGRSPVQPVTRHWGHWGQAEL